ncbi:MAG: IS1634 family transposase, partial [Thermoplasmata archaeon]
ERAKELEKSRNDKIEKIRELVNEKNKYLSDHARADVSTALSLVNEKIKKLNIESFTRIEESGRTLMVKVDENALRAESYLDGCYVIRSNLPVNEGSMETIHQRYKDLANVEWAFRTMKSDTIELRPIYVRKKPRTRAHVFIAMLSYTIEKYLEEKWKDLNITVEEGIHELMSINSVTV